MISQSRRRIRRGGAEKYKKYGKLNKWSCSRVNGSLILGWTVIGGTFGWNYQQGETFSMACLQAKAMVKLHPIAMVAPKPIMAWVTASTERDCQKKRFYSEGCITTTCKVSCIATTCKV